MCVIFSSDSRVWISCERTGEVVRIVVIRCTLVCVPEASNVATSEKMMAFSISIV